MAYATVTTSTGALIIGGFDINNFLSTVARFDGSIWKKMDDLHSARRGHRAIVNGNKIYVVGGQGNGTNLL